MHLLNGNMKDFFVENIEKWAKIINRMWINV